jgi:hypothetical protein
MLKLMNARGHGSQGNVMANFTPVSAAIGGALIGLSAALLMLLTGRIAGISGIFGGCLGFGINDKGWRIAFIAGLILAPLIGSWVGYAMPSPQMPASWTVTVAAGLLVGLGTRLGGGCTSGHGHLRNRAALRPFHSGHRHFHVHGDCSRCAHSSRARRLSHAGHHRLDLRVDIRLGLADFGYGAADKSAGLS